MKTPAHFHPRVLIVEDEYFLADDMARHFVAAGAELVGFAPTARQALAIVDREPHVDVAVLDVRLGSGDVFEVADRLRDLGVCLVFYTATEPSELPERFRDDPVVQKPIGADQVYLEAMRSCAARGTEPMR